MSPAPSSAVDPSLFVSMRGDVSRGIAAIDEIAILTPIRLDNATKGDADA